MTPREIGMVVSIAALWIGVTIILMTLDSKYRK